MEAYFWSRENDLNLADSFVCVYVFSFDVRQKEGVNLDLLGHKGSIAEYMIGYIKEEEAKGCLKRKWKRRVK